MLQEEKNSRRSAGRGQRPGASYSLPTMMQHQSASSSNNNEYPEFVSVLPPSELSGLLVDAGEDDKEEKF